MYNILLEKIQCNRKCICIVGGSVVKVFAVQTSHPSLDPLRIHVRVYDFVVPIPAQRTR